MARKKVVKRAVVVSLLALASVAVGDVAALGYLAATNPIATPQHVTTTTNQQQEWTCPVCPFYVPPCAAAWLDNMQAREYPAPQCVMAWWHGSPSLYPSRSHGIQFN